MNSSSVNAFIHYFCNYYLSESFPLLMDKRRLSGLNQLCNPSNINNSTHFIEIHNRASSSKASKNFGIKKALYYNKSVIKGFLLRILRCYWLPLRKGMRISRIIRLKERPARRNLRSEFRNPAFRQDAIRTSECGWRASGYPLPVQGGHDRRSSPPSRPGTS